MNSYNKWSSKKIHLEFVLHVNLAVYRNLRLIKLDLLKYFSLDSRYNKELEIKFANIRV
jgi:hypothetical protein